MLKNNNRRLMLIISAVLLLLTGGFSTALSSPNGQDGLSNNPIAPPNVNLVQNGTFDQGVQPDGTIPHWSKGGDLEVNWTVEDGVLSFQIGYFGGSADAVNTTWMSHVVQRFSNGYTLPPNASLEVRFDLGNTYPSEQGVSVRLHNAHLSWPSVDNQSCFVRVPPGGNLQSYTMHVPANGWETTYISFWPSDTMRPNLLVDNVEVYYRPELNVSTVQCPLNSPALKFPENKSLLDAIGFTFEWLSNPNAVSYDLEIADNPNFDNPIHGLNLSETSWQANSLGEGRYYWRVRAKNDIGDGPWSEVYRFDVRSLSMLAYDTLAFFEIPINPMSSPTSRGLRILPTLASNADHYRTTGGVNADMLGQWVMGDWDGEWLTTPGVFQDGVFRLRNDPNLPYSWSDHWVGASGFAVAGRFDPSLPNDCLGVINQATLADLTVFAMYYICDFSSVTPEVQWHWMGALLNDNAGLPGLTGDWEFAVGDWNGDGAETPAVRRGPYIAWSNVPIVNPAAVAPQTPQNTYAEFSFAQYFDAEQDFGEYGRFVAGDWDGDGIASFGLYFGTERRFVYRNHLAWNEPLDFRLKLNLDNLPGPYFNVSDVVSYPNPPSVVNATDTPFEGSALEAPLTTIDELELLPLDGLMPEDGDLQALD